MFSFEADKHPQPSRFDPSWVDVSVMFSVMVALGG